MFEGTMVALVTPFRNGSLDIGRLRALTAKMVDAGVDTIVPTGTTGESATLNHEEHLTVIRHVIEEAKGKAKVLAGTGSNATHEAIALTRAAKEAGADGALLISPYYNKPTQEGLYQHFALVAKEVSLPIVLYNIPGRTAVKIETETLARLSKIPNIVGVKDSTGSLETVMDSMNACRAGFEVYSGEDGLNVPILAVGGHGVVSVLGNLMPKELVRMVRLALSGNIAEAAALQRRYLPLIHALFLETNPIPIKAALALLGEIEEEYRLPLVPMSEQNKRRLKEEMERAGLL
jgi:4-hydroxy-tetrahydrodipicolinate synthase